jgi:hypothetical protein
MPPILTLQTPNSLTAFPLASSQELQGNVKLLVVKPVTIQLTPGMLHQHRGPLTNPVDESGQRFSFMGKLYPLASCPRVGSWWVDCV